MIWLNGSWIDWALKTRVSYLKMITEIQKIPDNSSKSVTIIYIYYEFAFSVEAVHLANLLCQFGYYFPVNELKNLLVKDDSSLYRFQVNGYIFFRYPYLTLRENAINEWFQNPSSCFLDTILLAFSEPHTWQYRIRNVSLQKEFEKSWQNSWTRRLRNGNIFLILIRNWISKWLMYLKYSTNWISFLK